MLVAECDVIELISVGTKRRWRIHARRSSRLGKQTSIRQLHEISKNNLPSSHAKQNAFLIGFVSIAYSHAAWSALDLMRPLKFSGAWPGSSWGPFGMCM